MTPKCACEGRTLLVSLVKMDSLLRDMSELFLKENQNLEELINDPKEYNVLN